MRKMSGWAKALARQMLSCRADARSRPKGFSTMTRPRSARPTEASPLTTFSKTEGGMAR